MPLPAGNAFRVNLVVESIVAHALDAVKDSSHESPAPDNAFRCTELEDSNGTRTGVQVKGEVGVTSVRDTGIEPLYRPLHRDDPTI